jgi:hypothetical protein
MYYTNGSNTYSNADVTINTGDGLGGLFGSLSDNSGRTWDGTANYTLQRSIAPEPTSLALLSLAIPGLWLLRRRVSRCY